MTAHLIGRRHGSGSHHHGHYGGHHRPRRGWGRQAWDSQDRGQEQEGSDELEDEAPYGPPGYGPPGYGPPGVRTSGEPSPALAELGTVLSPGIRELSANLSLDEDHRLHARLCVDGRCYDGSADLSELLADLAARIATYHADLHLQQGALPEHAAAEAATSPEAVDHVHEATEETVHSAGVALVGRLFDQHRDTISGLDWGDISDVLKVFKPVIKVAATAVATYYGGQAAGEAAARYTEPLVDYGASLAERQKKPKDLQAQRQVAAAEEQARSDPHVAQALSAAKDAVAHTAATYRLGATAIDAHSGDLLAQQKMTQLRTDAASGDPAAQRALSVVEQVLSAAGIGSPSPPTAPDGAPVVSGAHFLPWLVAAALGAGAYALWRRERAPRGGGTVSAGDLSFDEGADVSRAVQAVTDLRRMTTGRRSFYYGFVKWRTHGSPDGQSVLMEDNTLVQPFKNREEMLRWYNETAKDPTSVFVAYFDATSESWPRPIRTWSESSWWPARDHAHGPD